MQKKADKQPREMIRVQINVSTTQDVSARKMIGKFGKDVALRLDDEVCGVPAACHVE